MPAAIVADPRLGSELAGYRIEALVGEGGMGVVYLARDPWLDRSVALKLITPRLAAQPSFRERFLRESRLAASLENAHVIPIYEAGEADDVLYLAMRFVEGTDLAGLINKGPLEPAMGLAILERVAIALDAAHAKGLVHRDVKPGNILLSDAETDGAIGAVYVSDFGLSKHAESGSELSDAGHVLGTLDYVAPEQIEGAPIGPQTDVYALGCVLYECLTGEVLFPGVSKTQLLWSHLEYPPPNASDAGLGLPVALDAVIERALAKSPEQRFTTCGELIGAASLAVAGELDASALAAQTRAAVEPRERRNPYKGLRAFAESDADDFFGRGALVDELVNRLANDRLVAVVGPSGSGKSSAVRAGVLPRLRQGALSGSASWQIVEMVPGAHPLRELEAALSRIPATRLFDPAGILASAGLAGIASELGDGRADSELLVVVDQFEELFTMSDESRRTEFVGQLAEAVADPAAGVRVLLTLRADFYDRPLRVRELSELIEDGSVAVHPLSPEELEEAIVAPARAVGLELEAGLLADIVADVLDQPGALPLLQHALAELSERAEDGRLTIEAYRAIGGATGAVALRADELYAKLDSAGKRVTRRLFTRLVTLGEGSDDTRRRILRSEVAALESDAESVEAVVNTYGLHRLLSFDRDPITGGPTVEIAHEALLHEWPRLREWVDEDRDGLRLLRRVGEAASGWHASDRDPGDLYRGLRLEQALAWQETHGGEFNPLEAEFLEESRELHETEETAERDRLRHRLRQNRRLRFALAVVAVALVGAIVAGVLALSQSRRADREAGQAIDARTAAETRRLVSDAAQLVATDRRVALLLAAEAYRRDPGPASLGAIQRVLISTDGFLGYLGSDRDWRDVTFLDNSTIAAVSSHGLSVFDIEELEERLSVSVAELDELETSRDARTAAVASGRGVRLVDLGSGTVFEGVLEHPSKVLSMSFSPDAKTLATGDLDGTVRQWNLQTGAPIQEFLAHPERTSAEIEGVPEGVEIGLLHAPETLRAGVTSLAFSPDGRQLVTGGLVVVRIWDSEDGARQAEFFIDRPGPRGLVRALTPPIEADIPEGPPGVLRVGTAFGVLHLDAQSGARLSEVTSDSRVGAGALIGTEASVALGAGTTVLGRYPDRNISVISSEGASTSVEFETLLPGRSSVALSGDGRTAAVAASGGILLWALDGRRLIATAIPTAMESGGPNLSPDGERLSLDTPGRRIQVWDISRPDAREIEIPEPNEVSGLFWTANGVFSIEDDSEVIGHYLRALRT